MYNQSYWLESNILDKKFFWFKTVLIHEILAIMPDRPAIEKIRELEIWPEIIKTKLFKTICRVSNDGEIEREYKLMVRLKLKERLSYVSDEEKRKEILDNYEVIRTIYVVLPEEMEGLSTQHLYRSERLHISPYVECNHYRVLDQWSLQQCVLCLINIEVV